MSRVRRDRRSSTCEDARPGRRGLGNHYAGLSGLYGDAFSYVFGTGFSPTVAVDLYRNQVVIDQYPPPLNGQHVRSYCLQLGGLHCTGIGP